MSINPFSIIVLNHNNQYIDYCITSIQKHKEHYDEIIIVDDHSTLENYNALLKYSNTDCKIIRNTEQAHNLSYNRNIGAKNAKYDRLLFLDGDVYFYDDCINQLRQGLSNIDVVCTTAFADAMNIAPLQLELIYNEDFLQYIKENTLNKIVTKHFIRDYRRDLSISILQGDHNWSHFFGVCLAVQKSAYYKAGQFDERLSGWGIEDIDFTFRLKNYGKLLFIPEAQLFHIPHIRDRYKNYKQNAYNNIECLKKYEGIIEWELNYKLANLYDALSVIDRIRFYHRNISYQLPLRETNDCIYINSLSGIFPNGYITAYNDVGKKFCLKYLGICLPFKNKQFKMCYLSIYILNYPAPILSMLLQEACRIAYTILIPKETFAPAIRWGKDIERKCKQHTLRFETFPVKLSDFIFLDIGNCYKITTSLPDSPFEEKRGVYYELI